MADETATTWRVGDLIVYRFACHDAEAMIAVAQSEHPEEVWANFGQNQMCFLLRRPIPARLEAWIAGPFDHSVFEPGSVWRVLDVANDTEFIWLDDTSGPHAARPQGEGT